MYREREERRENDNVNEREIIQFKKIIINAIGIRIGNVGTKYQW